MSEATRHRILIVDDDVNLCEVLADLLETSGFEAKSVADGSGMLAELARGGYSLVLLDLRLKQEDGLALARALRTRSRIPIIMLTGQGDDTDRVLGLETAADDFEMKPFSNRELVARIRALLRRTSEIGAPPSLRTDAVSHERYRFGDWIINLSSRELSDVRGTACEL